ncbi:hypothetical protein [Halorussus lipolyticus]|uniref:hypothetical protein n=1 Tax=Halorussus lipolyticus TaxID=3034024 RepID=UPI0023E8CF97|nr:hypothetical protein [Halorussus sp. DT80]
MRTPDLSHAVRIARVEVRRSVRAVRSSTTRTAAFGVALLFWVALPTVGGGFLAYRLGQSLPAIPFEFPVLDAVRGATAVGWVGLAVLSAARTAGKKGELDSPEGILTTVPARDAALGLLLAEYARMALVAAIPVVTIATALAVGAGVVTPLVAVPATAGILLAVALSIGFPVGIGVKWATMRSPWLARHKTALLVVAFGLYFLGVTSQAFNDVISLLQRTLRNTPLAWFGDAVLLGLPGIEAVPVHVLGAGALAGILLPTFAGVGIRSATTLWYADRAQVERDEPSAEAHADRNGRVAPGGTTDTGAPTSAKSGAESASIGERALSAFDGVLARPTRTVTLSAWRRAKRTPIRLLYVAYPLFFLYAPLRSAFESGVPTSLPALVALYGAWAVGAMVLNPLGDEGAVLPATLLSGVSGRQFVVGHVVSATLVGVPVVTAAVAVAGALSPLDPARWIALAGVSALLVVAGATLAVGVGVLFPRFGTVEVFRSREITMPSKGAFAAYSIALLGGAVGAVVVLVPPIAGFVGGLVGFPQVVVTGLGAGLGVSVGLLGPAAAYRYATREFEEFTVD